jgi:hypothetical protein
VDVHKVLRPQSGSADDGSGATEAADDALGSPA